MGNRKFPQALALAADGAASNSMHHLAQPPQRTRRPTHTGSHLPSPCCSDYTMHSMRASTTASHIRFPGQRLWPCTGSCAGRAISRHSTRCQAAQGKHKLVFLGTPDPDCVQVAAEALLSIHRASQQEGASFEVAAVVSQPGKPRGRGNKSTPLPTPVEQAARDLGLPDGAIMCPKSAKEGAFLSALQALAPDLCVTAAYGNMLPQAFLDIPRLGTLNIHPSLLPKYRGAAPVQRAVQDGVAETGVSVAYTVLKCDAGPVLAQERVTLDAEVQAPELLSQLFRRGASLLIRQLPDVFEGRGPQLAWPQDEAQVVHAAKLTKEESQLDFASCTAQALHDKVRGFAGWPGTSAAFVLEDEATGTCESLEIKVCRTRVLPASGDAAATSGQQVSWSAEDTLLVPCKGGGTLEVLQVQPPTKKVMSCRDWRNGIRKKMLKLAPRA